MCCASGACALAGQQRRVEIARAIASRPRILFADEAAGDVDARGAAQMLRILWQLNRGGTTVVMATHSAECAAMADEVVYLADGLRIEGNGGRPLRHKWPIGNRGFLHVSP